MAEQQFVLIETATGQRWSFGDRSEYLATFYGGGFREEKAAAEQASPVAPRRPDPAPRRVETTPPQD